MKFVLMASLLVTLSFSSVVIAADPPIVLPAAPSSFNFTVDPDEKGLTPEEVVALRKKKFSQKQQAKQSETPAKETVQPGGAETAKTVIGAVNEVEGFFQGGAESVSEITGAFKDLDKFLGVNQGKKGGTFNPNEAFPAWGNGGQVSGVIGSNGGSLNNGSGKLIIYFIPKVIEILIWLVAPVLLVMLLFSGLQFIYGGDREEETKKARDSFRYSALGLVFVVMSYSFMKAVYFILA